MLGIINLSNDSFTGDGVFNHDEGLKKLLQSAKQKNIVRKWDNDRFVLIYILSISRSFSPSLRK